MCIPVGPSSANQRWLQDAIDSVYLQTYQVDEILLIDDMANLSIQGPRIRVHRNPWHSGVAHSFNFGVALAENDLVLMMGSDDLLEPECIEACLATYHAIGRLDRYYWLDVQYMSNGEAQSIACNAAMVTKGLWRKTGGIPIESACGAGDAALLSCLLAHKPQWMHRVQTDKPLYKYRDHAETDTIRRSSWMGIVVQIRNLVTEEWKEQE